MKRNRSRTRGGLIYRRRISRNLLRKPTPKANQYPTLSRTTVCYPWSRPRCTSPRVTFWTSPRIPIYPPSCRYALRRFSQFQTPFTAPL